MCHRYPGCGKAAPYRALRTCLRHGRQPGDLEAGGRQPVEPDFYTDITSVLARKRALLACHASQKDWLDATQGMDAYLDDMEHMSREVGTMSGRFEFAEGWRRHSHLGFGPEDFDPLQDLLKV